MFKKQLIYFLATQFIFASFAFAEVANKIKIAVIDTGVDIFHKDLVQNLWVNKKEIPDNGIDDDANGYIDDIHGWNFADNNSDLSDLTGHGTHINGLICLFNKEDLDRSYFEIINLKYYRPGMDIQSQLSAFKKSIRYAIDQKVDVINISAGGYSFRYDEYEALKEATDMGIIVVAASGNKKAGQKSSNFYPSAYNLKNLYSVSATDESGHVLETTNINPYRENVLISGKNLYSTTPGNSYSTKTGSSQAAAIYSAHLISQKIKKFVLN